MEVSIASADRELTLTSGAKSIMIQYSHGTMTGWEVTSSSDVDARRRLYAAMQSASQKVMKRNGGKVEGMDCTYLLGRVDDAADTGPWHLF